MKWATYMRGLVPVMASATESAGPLRGHDPQFGRLRSFPSNISEKHKGTQAGQARSLFVGHNRKQGKPAMLDPRASLKPVKIDYSLLELVREAEARARAMAAARHEDIVRRRKMREKAYNAGGTAD
jgi:hypothetical protein